MLTREDLIVAVTLQQLDRDIGIVNLLISFVHDNLNSFLRIFTDPLLSLMECADRSGDLIGMFVQNTR